MTQPDPEQRLRDLGLTLPEPPEPVAAYIPSVRTGNVVVTAGQIPVRDGVLIAMGSVPGEVSLEDAVECARQCALNGLAVVKREAGSLDRIRRVVRLGCFVQAESGFGAHPQVANGASELMLELFGDRGRHARAAVGASGLPLNAPVEIEFTFEIEPDV